MNSEKIKKQQEEQVVKRLLHCLSKEEDYFIQTPTKEPPDFFIIKKSDKSIIHKLEITNVDKEINEKVEKDLSIKRRSGCYPSASWLIINQNKSKIDLLKESIDKIVKQPIKQKLAKPNYKDNIKDLVFLLDGWHARQVFTEMEARYLKNEYRDFFKSHCLKEVWLVYLKISYLLFPDRSNI